MSPRHGHNNALVTHTPPGQGVGRQHYPNWHPVLYVCMYVCMHVCMQERREGRRDRGRGKKRGLEFCGKDC